MAADCGSTETSGEGRGGCILCVGLICLDIINLCDHYPEEDQDIRAKGQWWRSGGNANNSLTVLSLLGRRCEFLGTLGSGMETDFVLSLLDKVGVAHGNCVYHTDCRLPTSYIVLNTTNGSRTIIHYRDLPELRHKDFLKLDLSHYSWIHFEGRNVAEYTQMMQHVTEYNQRLSQCQDKESQGGRRIVVSVEVEKMRPQLVELLPLADVVLVSKDYAGYQGYGSMEEAVRGLGARAKKGAIVVCAWGERGAAAIDSEGKVHVCGSFPPPQVVDTLAAGDTFNAGIIHQLSLSWEAGDGSSLGTSANVGKALEYACRLAGAKCGMEGLHGLRNFSTDS